MTATAHGKEATEWHNITQWGNREGSLDGLAQYLVKGKEVHVEGELRTRTWEKDGQTHYRTEVHAMRVQLCGGNGRQSGGHGGHEQPHDDRSHRRGGDEPSAHDEPTTSYIDPNDIPF